MTNLQIEFLVAALILLFLIIIYLKRSSLSIKNSIIWLLLPIIFILIAIFPEPLTVLSKWFGFEALSNFIFVIIIAFLIIFCFFLTITTSRQQEKINKLIQEISILKGEKKNGKKRK